MTLRIILLAYTKDQHTNFMSGLKTALTSSGHTVRSIFQWGDPKTDTEFKTNYSDFDLFWIEEFQPDLIISFNGYAKETFGVISYLAGRYKMMFVERGWLPQRGNIYIDSVGLGGRSSLAKRDLSSPTAYESVINDCVESLYETTYKTDGHSELGDYILLPLQLDHDTSIVLDSPYFKTMQSLVSFITRKFYNQKVVVRPHPLCMDIQFPPSVIVEKKKSTLDLAKTAKAIIGINSTTLIESLIHYRPTALLGSGVLSSTPNIVFQGRAALQHLDNILDFEPNRGAINATLFNLLNIQFPANNVPERVIKEIELAV